MNPTHPLARRIAAGIGISLFGSLALAAFLAPAGAFEGRAASVRVHGPAMTLTTATSPPPVTAPSYPVPEEPVVTTTTTMAAPVEVAPTTTTTLARKTSAVPSGHFTCPGGMDAATQYDPGPACRADVVTDPGPNPLPADAATLTNGADGDQPGQTLGSTDPAYGAWLSARSCEVKPWTC